MRRLLLFVCFVDGRLAYCLYYIWLCDDGRCTMTHTHTTDCSVIIPFECVCNVPFQLVKNVKNVVVTNEQRTTSCCFLLFAVACLLLLSPTCAPLTLTSLFRRRTTAYVEFLFPVFFFNEIYTNFARSQ